MKRIFLLLFCAAFAGLHAQLIEENQTKILDKIQGKPLFELDENVEVFSFQPEEGWYKIRREIYLDPNEIADEKILNEGTVLKNKEGKEIGRVLSEIQIKESKISEKFRGKERVQAIIEGWVFKTKFADGSLPETRVSELLKIANRSEQQAGFQALFKQYDFEEREFEELTAYTMRERHKTVADEKDFRLIVIFRGETPYAVLTHHHKNITAEKIKTTWEKDDFKVIYFYKPTAAQQSLIQEDILYTYLAL